MQKILTSIICLTLLLSFAVFPTVPKYVYATTQTVTVQGEIVNVRQGPGLTYEIIQTYAKGDQLTVLGAEGDWLKVESGRHEGWVANWLVSSPTTTGEKAESRYIISQVDRLNIRQQPSVSSAVIAQLFTGNEANLLREDGDWVQIQHGSKIGWVAKMYVTIAAKTSQKEAASSDVKQSQYFTINVDAVNVRAEGSLNAKKIGVAYRGAKYKVISTSNNWVQIQYENGVKAWIYSFYGSLNEQASTAKQQDTSDNNITIIYNGTNIRAEASTASAVVQRVDAGQALPVVGTEGDFYKVSLSNGATGYVANWVVSTNGQTGQAPAVATKTSSDRQAGTLKGVTLVIDAGHGGNDHGTTGVRGTREKDITLLTAEKLSAKLRAAGANVYLTRESDTYVDLRKRVAVSHQVAADAFISIHYDANENNSINGFTTYYTNGFQKELAQYVHHGLSQKLAIRDRGVQFGNYLVLRENRQKSILIELGFLSNANEERAITTDYYREQATLGMYEGILNYFDAQL